MAHWSETDEEAYAQLQEAHRLLVPTVGDILPRNVRGVLLWRNSNVLPSERATEESAIGVWKTLGGTKRRTHEQPTSQKMILRMRRHSGGSVERKSVSTKIFSLSRNMWHT